MDSTGDGVGDLAGITSRLDYVAGLGVDAIWLSPYFTSPMVDGGYDVVDHCAVDPRLGTLADFDALVARAHGLGLQVMIDQVLNHTSEDHAWFQAALAGDDAMAARYLFRDPKPDGTAPNNWISMFGPPAWSWAHTRRQYYFHQFLTCQPSLNLRHPDVQRAHREQIAVWRDRGVDGFRFDAVTAYLWDETLADNPPASAAVQAKVAGEVFNPYTYQDHLYDMLPGNGAAFADNLRDWAGRGAWLMGEISSGNKSYELAMDFTVKGRLDAAYTTDLPAGLASAPTIAELLSRADPHRIVAWLSSHDQPRHGSGDAQQAVFLAAIMAVLPGPWLIYQGEELGLPQPELTKAEVTDPFDLAFWPDGPGREGARVPMPWEADAPQFGFTEATPWLPMRWDAAHIKAAQAVGGVTDSYRRLINLRRALGWDEGQVTDRTHGKDWLRLAIATEKGPLNAWFAWPDADCERPDAPGAVFEMGAKGGYRMAIWPA
jgi:alpha-glucosidase